MTKLSAIAGHIISIECAFGHNKSIAVTDLLDRVPETTTVEQIQAASKCLRCGERGKVQHVRIVFMGGE